MYPARVRVWVCLGVRVRAWAGLCWHVWGRVYPPCPMPGVAEKRGYRSRRRLYAYSPHPLPPKFSNIKPLRTQSGVWARNDNRCKRNGVGVYRLQGGHERMAHGYHEAVRKRSQEVARGCKFKQQDAKFACGSSRAFPYLFAFRG